MPQNFSTGGDASLPAAAMSYENSTLMRNNTLESAVSPQEIHRQPSLKRMKTSNFAENAPEPRLNRSSTAAVTSAPPPTTDGAQFSLPVMIKAPSQQLPSEFVTSPGTPDSNAIDQTNDTTTLAKATAAYADGNYAHAAALCRQLCATRPPQADILLLLGAATYQLKDYYGCVEANDAAIVLNPSLPEAHCNLANALQQLGNIELAIIYYNSAIRLRPSFLDAYANLASAYLQRGMPSNAAGAYTTALAIDPSQNEVRCSLGDLWRTQGTPASRSAAVKLYREALQRDSECGAAWRGLGDCARESGAASEAVQCYEEAVRLTANCADAHTGLGLVLRQLKRRPEAEAAFSKAVQLRPGCALALGNLAGAQYEVGKLEEAIQTYRHAVAINPNFPEGLNNLGNVLRESGRLEEAIVHYSASVQMQLAALATSQEYTASCGVFGGGAFHAGTYSAGLAPTASPGVSAINTISYISSSLLGPTTPTAAVAGATGNSLTPTVLNPITSAPTAPAPISPATAQLMQRLSVSYTNLAGVLKLLGRAYEAIAAYEHVVALQPASAEAHANLGAAYKDTGRHDEAIACYLRALTLRPAFHEATANLVHSMQCVCDWRDRSGLFVRLEAEVREDLQQGRVPSVQPFHAMTYPFPSDLVLDISRGYAKQCLQAAHRLPGAPAEGETLPHPPSRPLQSGERLRVGYVSSDFGNHPLSHLMGSVFGLHDHSRVEVFCYALSPNDGSEWWQRVSTEAEHFIDVSSFPTPAIARRMSADGIHIAINLNGYTKGARNEIFALRPAPVQVGFMGFPATTGADYIPWIVLDKTVCPPGSASRACYSENVAYMPHSYFVNDYRQAHTDVLDGTAVPTRASVGLPEKAVIFSCANQLYKLDPDTFDTWCRILHRVPNSVLWLLRFPPAGEARLRVEAAARGVHPARIVFTDVAPKPLHVARSGLADVFLDTPQCNAHTTGCDVLWGGCPMVTLPLVRMASRVAASLCTATGLGEHMVAHSWQEYEDRAVELGLNHEMRDTLRSALRAARTTCPLFDTPRWVSNFERGLLRMWKIHCQGDGPRDFDITEQIEDDD